MMMRTELPISLVANDLQSLSQAVQSVLGRWTSERVGCRTRLNKELVITDNGRETNMTLHWVRSGNQVCTDVPGLASILAGLQG